MVHPLRPSRRLVVSLMAALSGVLALGTLSVPAVAQDKVSVGVLRFVSSGGLFLAYEKGYFKAEGLDVELKFFEAAQPIALAAVSGDVDFGVTAFTGGFFNLAGKGALKIIAAQAKEAKGYEGNLVLASKGASEKGLADLGQLPGKSLGISQVGSSFHYQMGQIARIKAGQALVAAYGEAPVGFIDARDIADVTVQQSLAPKLVQGPLVLTGSQALSIGDIGKLASRITKRDLAVEAAPSNGIASLGFEQRAVAEFMVLLREGRAAATTSTVTDLLGRPPRTVEAFLAEHFEPVAA